MPQKITARRPKALILRWVPNRNNSEIGVWVRVKTCGKSARLCIAICIRGKPYQKQDKKACVGCSFRLNTRVCRIDKWLSDLKCPLKLMRNRAMLHYIIRSQNPAYCKPHSAYRPACVTMPIGSFKIRSKISHTLTPKMVKHTKRSYEYKKLLVANALFKLYYWIQLHATTISHARKHYT